METLTPERIKQIYDKYKHSNFVELSIDRAEIEVEFYYSPGEPGDRWSPEVSEEFGILEIRDMAGKKFPVTEEEKKEIQERLENGEAFDGTP